MTGYGLRAAALLALALTAACGGQQQTTQRTAPPGALRVDETKSGRIAGQVTFEGAAPQNPAINTGSDAVCARENKDGLSTENVVVENGGLNNVFVYVKDGLGKYYFD